MITDISEQSKYLLIALLLFLIGAYFRLNGIADVPLSVDEYYLTKSTLSILEDGLPNFISGGYYFRGLLQQYISALLIIIFGDVEFAMRILPVIAGLLTAIAVLKLTRKLANSTIALVAFSIILLSVWEIEFSRFARMYALHQAIFTWQLYFLTNALFFKKEQQFRYVCYLAFLAVFISEGAVFSVAICALPIFTKPKILRIEHYIIISLSLAAIYLVVMEDWRHLGMKDWLPPDFDRSDHPLGNKTLLLFPNLSVFKYLQSHFWILMLYITAAFLSVYWYIALLYNSKKPFHSIVLALLFIFPIIHMPGLAIISTIGLVGLNMYDFQRPKNTQAVISTLGNAILWTVFWLTIETLIFHSDSIRNTLVYLLKFPNFWDSWLYIWFDNIPLITSFILLGSLSGTPFLLKNSSPRARAILFLAGTMVYILALFGIINTYYTATRYTFFLYPSSLILAIVSYCYAAEKVVSSRTTVFTSIIILLVFSISDDFNIQHILNINKYEFVYRTHYPIEKREHFKSRYDISSAADFVNTHASQDDIVISAVAGTEFYLNSLDYRYVNLRGDKFPIISINQGKQELWTGASLIYRLTDLLNLLTENENDVWVIIRKNNIPDSLLLTSVFLSHDNSIAVLKIDRGSTFSIQKTGQTN